MAKAQAISELKPRAATRAGLTDVLSTRIAELWSWAGYLRDPQCVRELHDMRIAAKRVRYLFEIFQPCFGPDMEERLAKFKRLQDYLGDIHDCDVWSGHLCDQLRDVLMELGIECADLCMFNGAEAGLKLAVEEMTPRLAADSARGLSVFIADIVDRRSLLYAELLDFWDELTAEGFREQLLAAVALAAAGDPAAGTVRP